MFIVQWIVGIAALLVFLSFAVEDPPKPTGTGIHEIDVEHRGSAVVKPPFEKNAEYSKPFTPGTDPGSATGPADTSPSEAAASR